MKTMKKQYLEDQKSKDWMDKNLKPSQQSKFIREAVASKIEQIKQQKAGK